MPTARGMVYLAENRKQKLATLADAIEEGPHSSCMCRWSGAGGWVQAVCMHSDTSLLCLEDAAQVAALPCDLCKEHAHDVIAQWG